MFCMCRITKMHCCLYYPREFASEKDSLKRHSLVCQTVFQDKRLDNKNEKILETSKINIVIYDAIDHVLSGDKYGDEINI